MDPAWPVVKPGPTVRLPRSRIKPKPQGVLAWQRAVVLPDMQIGYYRDADGLQPTHDEAAIGVALAVAKEAKPDVIVLHGDNLDLPELSKYRGSPAYAFTTQAAIDRATVLGGELRAAAPNARIVWIAGNHEERLPNFLLDNAAAAFGIRRGNRPDGWPVMSVPHLCRLDDFGIEYLPGYPASSFWINQRLRVIHGDRVRSSGSTAHMYLNSEKTSVLFGHVHRIEWAEKTRMDWDGCKTILAASPGCLCRIDGAVPSAKGGKDLDGRPLRTIENWQQGLAVVDFQPGDGNFSLELISIHEGWARWRDREYSAAT